ncbi:response regulator transcription factor [uncultured Agathobaculum sp.]|uniref:response regulator transcription factor n=1 Tax=uncultured Agathobaculum sp. TaxID=2048140 RepID=UPI00296E5E54
MIYCVEDDAGIRELVVYTLRNTGFEADGCPDGAALTAALRKQTPQLILLDIMLPGEDGITILRRLRAAPDTADIPVILLTAKNTEYDKVVGLDTGADDYIAKPFGMMELVARIRAVLRRTEARAESEGPHPLVAGGICVDERAHTVFADGQEVQLTLKEYQLLTLLMKNRGAVLTRDVLLENIWGYGSENETRTVDVHIRTLRQKLGADGVLIETVRGVGYRMGEHT